LARLLGEVAGEALERLVLLLGLLVDDAMRAAHPLEGRQQVLAVDPRGRQELARGRALLVREREQQVLGRDVCVAQRFRLLVGAVGRLRQLARQGGLPGAARLLGEAVDLALGLGRELGDVQPRLLEQRDDDPVLLREQGVEQMGVVDDGIAAGARRPPAAAPRWL